MAKATKAAMGTKLAEMAGTTRLKGAVCITDAKGVTHQYADETAAHAEWADRIGTLEHRRGAFFEKEAPPPAPKPAESKPKAREVDIITRSDVGDLGSVLGEPKKAEKVADPKAEAHPAPAPKPKRSER